MSLPTCIHLNDLESGEDSTCIRLLEEPDTQSIESSYLAQLVREGSTEVILFLLDEQFRSLLHSLADHGIAVWQLHRILGPLMRDDCASPFYMWSLAKEEISKIGKNLSVNKEARTVLKELDIMLGNLKVRCVCLELMNDIEAHPKTPLQDFIQTRTLQERFGISRTECLAVAHLIESECGLSRAFQGLFSAHKALREERAA